MIALPIRHAVALAVAILTALSAQSRCLADDRPNVLWIVSDDLSPELGCYGYQGVKTPNLDRLAVQGTRYTNAFATAPVCSSSRSAFITGVYQTTTGTHHHRTLNKRPLPKPIEPITELLRRAGYFVSNCNSTMKRVGKSDFNFKTDQPVFDGVHWSQRKAGQPFFAQIQIKEPHRDFVVAKNPRRAESVQIPGYYPEHPVVRADWANYLESIEVLDRHVGAVLDRLEQDGLADNTVVFFFGDHGRPHYRDKQWLYDGGLRVPLIVRWPENVEPGDVVDQLVSLLDVSAATVALAGLDVPDWMDGRDLLADDFAGHNALFAARDRCGSTLDRARSVRTSRFKYIRNFFPDRPYSQHSGSKVLQYPAQTAAQVLHLRGELTGPPTLFWAERRPAEELYDVVNDPDEVHNLSTAPEHSATLIKMRNTLNRWIEQTGDKGQFAEVAETEAVESSERWYQGRMKKRGFVSEVNPETYLEWWESQLGIR